MAGVNGALLRRLVLVEERAPRPAPKPELTNALGSFWERVHAVAPEPIWRYILEVDAECAAATSSHDVIQFDDGAWLKRHHPAFDDVLDGLAHAVQKFGSDTGRNQSLTFTQGWLVMWSVSRLGWAFAYERAGGTRAVLYDQDIRDQAGLLLLGWTNRECNQRWADPCAFLEQWRLQKRTFTEMQSPDTLAKAGLFDAELALLDAEEER